MTASDAERIGRLMSLADAQKAGLDGIAYNLTDSGNAERLVAMHGDDIRYVPAQRLARRGTASGGRATAPPSCCDWRSRPRGRSTTTPPTARTTTSASAIAAWAAMHRSQSRGRTRDGQPRRDRART